MIRVESRASRVESQDLRLALRSDLPRSAGSLPAAAGPPPFSLNPEPRTLNPRPSFTLIELLVSILIISILAASLLGVAAVASETAREAKTRNMIARLHTLLMEHYDSYKSRRVKVRQQVLDAIEQDTTLNTPAKKGFARQQARLYAIREMMLLEMPCRWSDVLLNSVPASPASYAPLNPWYLDVSSSPQGRPELSLLYLRQYGRIAGATNKLTNQTNKDTEITANEAAECLYMIVINATGDGEAKSLFPESSIGDTDGDGAPEFLDGWGHPISFVRWAPGFVSDIQLNANDLPDSSSIPPTTVGSNSTWETAAKGDHDPFDLFRVDIAAFRLVPLIISGGRDEAFGIHIPQNVIWMGLNNVSSSYSLSGGTLLPYLSPYVRVSDGSPPVQIYIGSDDGTKTATDNIHNHLIGTR